MSSPKAPPLEARIPRPPHKQTRFPAGAEAVHALIPSQSEKTEISNVVPRITAWGHTGRGKKVVHAKRLYQGGYETVLSAAGGVGGTEFSES